MDVSHCDSARDFEANAYFCECALISHDTRDYDFEKAELLNGRPILKLPLESLGVIKLLTSCVAKMLLIYDFYYLSQRLPRQPSCSRRAFG